MVNSKAMHEVLTMDDAATPGLAKRALLRLIADAKESAKHRPEYQQFDFAVYAAQIMPLIKEIRQQDWFLKEESTKGEVYRLIEEIECRFSI